MPENRGPGRASPGRQEGANRRQAYKQARRVDLAAGFADLRKEHTIIIEQLRGMKEG